ncbi:tetratricopeptide repeat protein [Rosistilla oblonga]|uniref:tetratricopeptide repeat protein n=1 Tax=Rosistilla oblonga TaxID=2527990 RepID=UPI003A982789
MPQVDPMNCTHKTITTFAPRLISDGVLLLIACFVVGCDSETNIYPPAPFEHVGEGFPEIIALTSEPLVDDQPAFDEYWERRSAVFEKARNETILAGAPEIEKDLFDAAHDENFALARKLADQVLQENPDSLVGLYAMAHVEAYAENDFAYALNSIRRARAQAEAMGRRNPRDPIGQEWYIWILATEWHILFSLDRSEEVIAAAERIEQIYAPVPWMKDFSLIKLERFDEARAEIAKYRGLGTFDLDADNSVMVIEDKLKRRESSLEAARAMCQRFPERRVLQYNLGLAAISNASFAEAEQAFLAAAAATDDSASTTPYVPLAALLVQQGRFPEALDALKQAQIDRGQREPYTLHNDEANTNLAIASVLLAYNEADLALRFARRATESPDRAGSTSINERELRISDGLVLWTIQKYAREELQEQLSIGAVPSGAALAQLTSLQSALWQTKQKFTSELIHSLTVDLVRPHRAGGIGIESQILSWHQFMLLDLIPLGVLEVALSAAEKGETPDWVSPYQQAIRAGIRLRKHDDAEALRLATAALEELPPRAEKVFRGFVAAIAGQAAWRLDQPDEAIGHWSTAMRDFPQAFRLLDIQIPIRLSHQGSDLEQKVVATLAASSRFFEDPRGCEIIVRPFQDQQLLIEMFRNDRSRHLEILVPIISEEGFVETTVELFHQRFFQPLVELTQADLGSLDGSPVAARMRREVDQLLSDFIQAEQPSSDPEPQSDPM